MKQKTKEYIDNPDYVTLKEAAEDVGIDPVTFKKYASRVGIIGTPVSKYTFYLNEDVEKVRKIVGDQVPVWLRMIERATGKKWAPIND